MKILILAALAALTASPALANCTDVVTCTGGYCRTVPRCNFGYIGNHKPAPVGRDTVQEMLQTYGPGTRAPICQPVNVCNNYGRCSVQMVCR
jgi:hypothetical protein